MYYHLEISKQGFVLADLPFKTIWGINTGYTVISPFQTTIANGFKWYIDLYETGSKSRRVKGTISYCDRQDNSVTDETIVTDGTEFALKYWFHHK